MKSTPAPGPAKSKKQKLASVKDPVQEKKARTAGLEEIESLFSELKSKKDEMKDAIITASSSSKKKKQSDNSTEINEQETKTSKPKKMTEEVNVPHGIIKSNNPRIIISPEAPVERIDPESGYKVYKAHILKVGEGGGTVLCPFDCDCCF